MRPNSGWCPSGVEFLDGCIDKTRRPAHDDDVKILLGQRDADRTANSATAAGNDRDLVQTRNNAQSGR